MHPFTETEQIRAESIILHAIQQFFIECVDCNVSADEILLVEGRLQSLEDEYLSNPDLIAEMTDDAHTAWAG